MFEAICELACRVGESVGIRVKHRNFSRSTVFFPAENTKTKHAPVSYLPKGLTNEIKSMLQEKGIITKRDDRMKPTYFTPDDVGISHTQKIVSGRYFSSMLSTARSRYRSYRSRSGTGACNHVCLFVAFD